MKFIGLLFSLGIVMYLALTQTKMLARETCETRCSGNEACMQALADEGLAPFESTKGDRRKCQGICATLKAQEVIHNQQAAESKGPKFEHPCLGTKSGAP